MKAVMQVVFCIVLAVALSATAHGECRTLAIHPPRGFLCLHCMHKNAPSGVRPFVRVLQKSCLKNVAMGFVTDGTFGYRAEEINYAIEELSKDGRKFFLHLYVYNGPAQRRWTSGTFRGFAQMDPADFRDKIQFDETLRATFKAQTAKLIPILELAALRHVTVTLAPAVEDNLNDDAFMSTLDLIRDAIPRTLRPQLVRSPCSDCAFGNDATIPDGVLREKHTAKSDFTVNNGIVTTDGDQFQFAGDAHWKRPVKNGGYDPSGPLITGITPALRRAETLKDMFLLWVAKYQDSPDNTLPRSPDKRKYRIPTSAEARTLINFFRTADVKR